MGLEVVELILMVEKDFGVEIPNKDANKIQTPGELADWVVAHVKTGKNASCLSQARFHRLRALLMETSVPRRKIRPSTPLTELLQEDNARQEFWARLKATPNARDLPRLELPPAFQTGVSAITFCVPLAFALYLGLKAWNFFFFLLAWFILFMATSLLADRLTRRKRTRLPQKLKHVAALLPFIEIPSPVWTREIILERIILEIGGITGIPVGEISEHAHFIKDLGMDC
jgi:acyl carrier protein